MPTKQELKLFSPLDEDASKVVFGCNWSDFENNSVNVDYYVDEKYYQVNNNDEIRRTLEERLRFCVFLAISQSISDQDEVRRLRQAFSERIAAENVTNLVRF